MNEIDHEYTDEIVCPNCGYELSDSWEMPDSGEYDCCECQSKFEFERDIEITYKTTIK